MLSRRPRRSAVVRRRSLTPGRRLLVTGRRGGVARRLRPLLLLCVLLLHPLRLLLVLLFHLLLSRRICVLLLQTLVLLILPLLQLLMFLLLLVVDLFLLLLHSLVLLRITRVRRSWALMRRKIIRVYRVWRPRHIVLRTGSILRTRGIVLRTGWGWICIGTRSVLGMRCRRVGIRRAGICGPRSRWIRARASRTTIRRRIVRRTRLACRNRCLESGWSRRRRHRGTPMIDRRSQIGLRTRRLHLLRLCRHRRDVPVARG